MIKLQNARGTADVIGRAAAVRLGVVDAFRRVAGVYGFAPLDTPVVEDARAFGAGARAADADADRTMFRVHHDTRYVLRPEGTAGVVRAAIQRGWLRGAAPLRVAYCGPMFRRERPQRGRWRQFTQCGVELLGGAARRCDDDADVLLMARRFLDAAGVAPHHWRLRVNSLGGPATRAAFAREMLAFLRANAAALSPETRAALDGAAAAGGGSERVALNVLDSRRAGDTAVLARDDAPRLDAFRGADEQRQFDEVLGALAAAGVDNVCVDASLVRGLDYYRDVVYEFEACGDDAEQALGRAQATLLAGGRYDDLVPRLGGRDDMARAVGWAAGVDRIATLLMHGDGDAHDDAAAHRVTCAVASVDGCAERDVRAVCELLRDAGVAAVSVASGAPKLATQLKRAATHAHARFAVLVGGDEWVHRRAVQLRTMATGESREVAIDELLRCVAEE